MSEVIISGPAGRIEARYTPGPVPDSPLALVLHPHPQRGGNMHNKVAHLLHQVFRRRGFAGLRFNFRGVGRSQGRFDHGDGELHDASAALDWLQANHPQSRLCWIGGFSFGAWIGMQLLMRRPEIGGFIMVAPPANLYDFNFLAPCPSSGLILQGDCDDIVPESAVTALVTKLKRQKSLKIDYRLIQGADHFFGDHLPELDRILDEYLAQTVTFPSGSPLTAS